MHCGYFSNFFQDFLFVFGFLQLRVSLIAQFVKNLPAMQETPVGFLGLDDLLERG